MRRRRKHLLSGPFFHIISDTVREPGPRPSTVRYNHGKSCNYYARVNYHRRTAERSVLSPSHLLRYSFSPYTRSIPTYMQSNIHIGICKTRGGSMKLDSKEKTPRRGEKKERKNETRTYMKPHGSFLLSSRTNGTGLRSLYQRLHWQFA